MRGSSSSDSSNELPSNDATVTPASEFIDAEIPDSETSNTEALVLKDPTPKTTPDTADLDAPSIREGELQILLHEEVLIPGSDGLTLASMNQTDHADF